MLEASSLKRCGGVLLLTLACGCGDNAGNGALPDGQMQIGDGPGSGDGPGANDHDLAGSSDGPRGACVVRTCEGKTYQCGDCVDNDGDGRIDADDPDCLGACQNNESGFFGNIPGQNNAPCKADCYFDQDTGSGNDSCEWDHRCDPHEVQMSSFSPESGCNYDPGTRFPGGQSCADRRAEQTPTCKSFCGPLTPNGCDCFGCCAIFPNASQIEGVWLGSVDADSKPTCDLAHATDPKRCKPCEIVASCFKTCGRCQLCIGKTEVPADCLDRDGGGGGEHDGGGSDQCPDGEQPCGVPGQPQCPQGTYCVTGCCETVIM